MADVYDGRVIEKIPGNWPCLIFFQGDVALWR